MRVDGREENELRNIEIEVGVLDRADGSAIVKWGYNMKVIETEKIDSDLLDKYAISKKEDKKIAVPEKLFEKIKNEIEGEVVGEFFKGNICVSAVFGPREPIPKHIADPYEAVLRFRYNMAPFSVPERKNPKPSRREIEISKVCRDALQYVVFSEEFPMTVIDVFSEIVASDAGTRVTALTAASVALADAGIPMRDIVSAVSVGRAYERLIVDLIKKEEDAPDAVDMPIAVSPRTEEVVLLQMDGKVSKQELDELIEMGISASKKISKIQREALKRKYERVISDE